jgi:hypothetical protein
MQRIIRAPVDTPSHNQHQTKQKNKFQSQKRLIATQLKPRKGKDIKWILIENIYSLFRELFL